jgi:hypothetical protein
MKLFSTYSAGLGVEVLIEHLKSINEGRIQLEDFIPVYLERIFCCHVLAASGLL